MHSKNIVANIRRYTIGYYYFTAQRLAYGWRQIGADGYAVMDDYGSLCFGQIGGDGYVVTDDYGSLCFVERPC